MRHIDLGRAIEEIFWRAGLLLFGATGERYGGRYGGRYCGQGETIRHYTSLSSVALRRPF
jgi:hypothetical protein